MTPILLRPPRPSTVDLLLDPPVMQVVAGRRARFLVRVSNQADGPQDIILRVEQPADGWSFLLPVRSVAVQALSTSVIVLRVEVPAAAQPGERATFRVVAAGSDRPDKSVSVVAEAVVA